MPTYPALGPSSSPSVVIATLQRTLPRTLLPLDRFARIVGYSPMLFHQVYIPDLQPDSSCSDPVLQYTWQPRGGGEPGRDEIANAIAQAEELIAAAMGCPPVPTWVVDDNLAPPRLSPGVYHSWWSLRTVTNKKHFVHAGREAWSLIQNEAQVAYTDQDGDGYDELATVTVTTTVTDPNEIVVFYPETNHDPVWEIRPIKVLISGGQASITFSRHLAVVPERLEELDAQGVNGVDDNNFLGLVDVWRRYNDPSQMAIVEWHPPICSDDLGQVSAQTGVVQAVDHRNGLLNIHAADWDADEEAWKHVCPTWWRHPDRIRLWYRAGIRDLTQARPMHEMSPDLERAISYLALTLMDRLWTVCEPLRNVQEHWRADLAHRSSSPSGSSSFQVSRQVLDNPFGTTRAAQYAWRVVRQHTVGQAVLAR